VCYGSSFHTQTENSRFLTSRGFGGQLIVRNMLVDVSLGRRTDQTFVWNCVTTMEKLSFRFVEQLAGRCIANSEAWARHYRPLYS